MQTQLHFMDSSGSTSPALVQIKVSTTAVVGREHDPQIGFCRWLPLLTDVCLVLLSFSGTCAQPAQCSSTGITNEHQNWQGCCRLALLSLMKADSQWACARCLSIQTLSRALTLLTHPGEETQTTAKRAYHRQVWTCPRHHERGVNLTEGLKLVTQTVDLSVSAHKLNKKSFS